MKRERRQSEGERAREELWQASVRAYNARQEQDHRYAWIEFRRKMRDLHWRLGDQHDTELQKLENGREETG